MSDTGAETSATARLGTDTALARLAALDARMSTALVELTAVAEETDAYAATAVRALQFEDMVTQLLACSLRRLDRLESVARVLDLAPAEAAEKIGATYAEDVRSPVPQTSIATGDVELF